MDLRNYLPSGQFGAMLGALVMSAGLIAAASQTYPSTAQLYASQTAAADLAEANPRWQNAFIGNTVPQDMAALQAQASEMSAAVQGGNLTESIAKSLVINTFALEGQGIADSSYSQDQIVEQMLAQAASNQKPLPPTYSQTDVALSSNSKKHLYTYGNALPKIFSAHPRASEAAALLPVATAVDRNSAAPLAQLTTIAREYRALAAAIVRLPTPPIFTPAAMSLANNYVAMAAAAEEMMHLHDDPVRGMLGLQNFKTLSNQNISLLLSVGVSLKNSGIVYGKSEPGIAWSALTSTVSAPTQQ